MTSALSAARIAVLRKLRSIEPYDAASQFTTSLGNAGGTTLFNDKLNYRADDSFNDIVWCILPLGATGSSTLEVQRVKDFDQLDGSNNTEITVYEAFSAQVASGAAMYLSSIHPTDLLTALNNATSKIYPWAFIPRFYNHVSNSRIMNGFFDFWNTTTLPEWWRSSSANITLTQDRTAPWIGQYNAKLVETAGGAQFISTDPVSPSYLQGDEDEKITLHAELYAEAASAIGISIQDGGGVETIVYHSGTAGWEEIVTAESTIQASRPGTRIEFHVDIAANATGYVGAVWTEGGRAIDHIAVPPQFRRTPAGIWEAGGDWPSVRDNFQRISGWTPKSNYPAVHPTADAVVGHSIRWDARNQSRNPRLLSIEGEDYIEEAALETDIYAVDAPFDELLWIEAIMELKMGSAQLVGSAGSTAQRQLNLDWEDERERLLEQPEFQMTKVPQVVQPFLGPPARSGGYYGPDNR